MITETQRNIRIFKDTLKVGYSYKVQVYKEQYQFQNKQQQLKIIWSFNTIRTIFNLANNKKNFPIAVLNFADPFDPGGLVWNGVKTQQECLCRSSTLYRSLNQENAIQEYYNYNKKLRKTTDRIIYSPSVLFFKDVNYKIVDVPVYCNVITCAAPLPVETLSDQKIKERMKKIIYVAKEDNNTIFILGNWGCGAFNNDLMLFKRLWKQVFKETNSILTSTQL